MATLNDWGEDPRGLVDEGLGDIAYEALENKAEEKAKEKAEELAKNTAKKAGKAVDKLTDKINPVKKAKDFVKDKISFVKKMKDKAKKAVKNLAKKGIKAVGKAALHAAKGAVSFLLANPLVAVCLIIGIIILLNFMDGSNEDTGIQTDETLLQSPVYVNIDGMNDDDVVVVLMGDCINQQYDTLPELSAEKVALAKEIYDVFCAYGLNNASMAGMLGCLDIESGFDSSAIEGIFSEYGFLGTRKAQAMLDLNNYTEHTLFPAYVKNGTSINKDGYKAIDDEGKTVYYCGLGLPQFTGPAAFDLLKTSKTLAQDWHNMEFQLAYMMSDCMYRPGFFAGWLGAQEEGLTDDDYDDWFDEYTDGMTQEQIDDLDPGTVAEAWAEAVLNSWIEAARASGEKFAREYEGVSSTSMIEERKDNAELWYLIIKDWDDTMIDQEYVDSITDLAAELSAITQFLDLEKTYFRCRNGNIFDNTSIAAAAVSFAWPTNEQSKNNGTNLYQTVHDGIFPGDLVYKACDRCVAMAVRWSGSDDTYPTGTSTQLSYLSGSAKWEFVGMSTEVSTGDLLPGDVFVLDGHTFIYTGAEIIQAAYGDEALAGSDSVSASMGERSAACNNSSTDIIVNNGGLDWIGRGAYSIFRCSDPDNSDTYSSIGYGSEFGYSADAEE